jgi:hypothetical protein
VSSKVSLDIGQEKPLRKQSASGMNWASKIGRTLTYRSICVVEGKAELLDRITAVQKVVWQYQGVCSAC